MTVPPVSNQRQTNSDCSVRQTRSLFLPTRAYNKSHFYMVRLDWFPGYVDWERRKYAWEYKKRSAQIWRESERSRAWLLFTTNIFNVRRDGPNCNCCLQTDCHPHCREMRPALHQNSILDSLQTQLLTTVLCHYVHQRIKFLIPSPSWHDWGSHWPHLLGGQNRVLTIGNRHSDLLIPL